MHKDTRWSSTGDRYLLKLFRDYVFHQADGHGRPAVDLGHIIETLNKAGFSFSVIDFFDSPNLICAAGCWHC